MNSTAWGKGTATTLATRMFSMGMSATLAPYFSFEEVRIKSGGLGGVRQDSNTYDIQSEMKNVKVIKVI